MSSNEACTKWTYLSQPERDHNLALHGSTGNYIGARYTAVYVQLYMYSCTGTAVYVQLYMYCRSTVHVPRYR